jgi:hypothetical protein
MSVNRNILQNSATPLAGDLSPTEVNLETTSGSRWVILDFLNTIPTSSNGSCTAVNLEWSPDPSMVTNPYQPSSSYYAVTSSVFSCQSASLSPQTGSIGWLQFIDSYWLRTPETPAGIPTEYYMRAQQTRNTSPVAIYSPTVAIQTRAEAYCGESYTSSLVIPYVFADMDGYYSPGFTNKWLNDVGTSAGPNQSASFAPAGGPPGTGSVYLVKAGGPNFDAFRIDGGGFNWPQLSISSSNPVRSGVGIVSGRAEWTFTSNALDFLIRVNADEVATTSSIAITKVSTGEVVGQIASGSLPLNLVNRYVEIILDKSNLATSEIRVDNNNVGSFNLGFYGAGGSITLKDNFQMTVVGLIRCVTAQMPYNPTVYHCKYGPVGAGSYTP